MNLLTIAWKSIRNRTLASTLTTVSVGLGVMLMVSVLVVHGIVNRVFSQSASGYDLIIGAKGSPLQLVLNSLYYLNSPVENIPFTYYKTIRDNPMVAHAIPWCMGDVTEEGSFRIVGTSPEFFEIEYMPRRVFRVDGHFLEGDWDAVVGAHVAKANGWKVGTEFKASHGVADADHVHDEKFTVVGILAPTGTPHDRAVFVHMDGFYQIAGHEKPLDEAMAKARAYAQAMGLSLPPEKPAPPPEEKHDHDHAGHDHHHHHELSDDQKEVTAILVRTKAATLNVILNSTVNEGPFAQSTVPFQQINWLLNNVVGNVRTVLVAMTGLIVLVSGVGIFVSIYNSMADRRREIAVMRALGARRSTVFSMILLESVVLCVGGGILGILLGHGAILLSASYIEQQSGLLINPWAFEPLEYLVIPVLCVLASLIGVIPGMTAYRTDVAQTLSQ